MTDARTVADDASRREALDVTRSFIVRAPAGSGKTRLLIQRYLALLARVDEPEEITAITFTRKAAAEMRSRVLQAFASAQNSAGAEKPAGHDEVTLGLARVVLAHDAERDWHLTENPSRLRIQTIDSLNASLTRQMPLSARFGAQPESIDDASALYREAARNLLLQVNGEDAVADDVATLLTHLDNNLLAAEDLLADMLRSRDQWLRNLGHMHDRELLERALKRMVANALAKTSALYPIAEYSETLALALFSGQNMSASGSGASVSMSDELAEFPHDDVEDLAAWRQISHLLLTQDGGWRKRRGLNKNNGFPTSTNAAEKSRLDGYKQRMGDLLERLSENPAAGERLRVTLTNVRALPPHEYSEDQWRVLGAIVRLLPYATAHLWNVFSAKGRSDFTEISQAASRALGSDDAPTDLALALDYRIRHLLIDEFQDTSFAQFELLEKLTRGWSEGDGRTLLAVGDPMQSIYRFREAEVALFLRATHQGIGGVPLHPLRLEVNFRSQPEVIEWVNHTFSRIMPGLDEASGDEVPYSASVAFATDHEENARHTHVTWHPQYTRKNSAADEDEPSSPAEREAARVVNIIQARRQEKASAEIAILVRNRTHLQEIVPALKAAGIEFRAVEIDPLKERPVVTDLLALTRAVLHPADRIAWLTLLRAPWCGLTLGDMAVLTAQVAHDDRAGIGRSVWQIICDDAQIALLPADARRRLLTLRDVMASALQQRRRRPLRDLVEGAWLALSGPACLQQPGDLDDAAMLMDLLESEAQAQAGGNDIVDLAALEMRVRKLFAGNRMTSNDAIPPVQIMTIHKAKGLEFDTVIVPGLHRTPRRDDRKLLVWTEQPGEDGDGSELLLAPIRETGVTGDADAIYRFVQQRDWEKQVSETIRLLYVAATRAERQLHLLAEVTVKDGEDGAVELLEPRAGSLLSSLWPAVAGVFEEMIPSAVTGTSTSIPAVATSSEIRVVESPEPMRLVASQPMPSMPASVTTTSANDRAVALTGNVDFEWAGETARHVGTVVHAHLQNIAESGIGQWHTGRVVTLSPRIEREMLRLGVLPPDVANATQRVIDALLHAVTDPRGEWLLRARDDARSEWRLSGVVDGRVVNVAIDRTFTDEEGIPWIIDFKTGGHEGGDVEAFLDNEQKRYREQLENYASLLHSMRDASNAPWPKIKLGLYFPLLKGWREWHWQSSEA